jgi:hypothetical protein
MGKPHVPQRVLLIVAAFSGRSEALDWARQRLEKEFGPVALASPPFEFNQTSYYELSMGPALRKQFLAFQHLVPPDCLPQVKGFTNDLEAELARAGTYPEPRPLNLDPGGLSLGQFVLATTKDQAHRLYLRDGVYAEVTLRFHGKQFEPWAWTYADYRESAVRGFFNEARDWYRHRLPEA